MFHTYMAQTDISTKSLQKGSAAFLVLSILDGRDRHGYELAQIIERSHACSFLLSVHRSIADRPIACASPR